MFQTSDSANDTPAIVCLFISAFLVWFARDVRGGMEVFRRLTPGTPLELSTIRERLMTWNAWIMAVYLLSVALCHFLGNNVMCHCFRADVLN